MTCVLGATLLNAEIHDGRARVVFTLADGQARVIEADHVVAATGFRVNMHRLSYLSPR